MMNWENSSLIRGVYEKKKKGRAAACNEFSPQSDDTGVAALLGKTRAGSEECPVGTSQPLPPRKGLES